MKYTVGIEYPYKTKTLQIWDVIYWCRDRFGIESKQSYPIPGPPFNRNPRWLFRPGLDGINTGPGWLFAFKYEKDATLFKMTWL